MTLLRAAKIHFLKEEEEEEKKKTFRERDWKVFCAVYSMYTTTVRACTYGMYVQYIRLVRSLVE